MSSPTAVRKGTLLVALGSSLWATDLIFRPELSEELTAAEVVFWEHLILALICLPILVRSDLRGLTRRDWISVVLVGAGASVVATVLFTKAFSYGEPTTVVLLQKVQPLVVIVSARAMLGERLKPNFWLYAIPAVVGAYLLATPVPSDVTIESLTPALLSIGAATLWGLGTVLGRGLLNTIPFMTQTALRFVVGLPMAAILLGVFGPEGRTTEAQLSDTPFLICLAVVPGLIAVSLYYRGLRQTPASTATLAELAFPLSSVVLGLILFDGALVRSQWIGFVVLGASITALSLAGSRTQPVVAPEETLTPT